MKTISILGLLAVGACLCATSNASYIAWDNFENANIGALSGQSGGSGWSGNWVAQGTASVVNRSMSYSAGDISISGGSQALHGGVAENQSNIFASRTFDSISHDVIYMSFLFQAEGDLANDILDLNLGTNPASFRPSVGVDVGKNMVNGAAAYSTVVYGADSIVRRNTNVVVGSQTDLVVVRITKTANGYNEVAILVNPTSATEPTTGWSTATLNLSSPEMNSLDTFLIRNFDLDNGDGFYIDNLTISTSYASAVTQIPEASSVSMVGGVILIVLGLRYYRSVRNKC